MTNPATIISFIAAFTSVRSFAKQTRLSLAQIYWYWEYSWVVFMVVDSLRWRHDAAPPLINETVAYINKAMAVGLIVLDACFLSDICKLRNFNCVLFKRRRLLD